MGKRSGKRGFRRGAVLMEYVIIAVLVAAACAAAVIVFGRAMVAGFDVAGRGTVGDGESAGNALSDGERGYRKQLQTNMEEAEAINKKFSNVSSTSGDKK